MAEGRLDDLDGARGILNATALSVPLWGLILACWQLLGGWAGERPRVSWRHDAAIAARRPPGAFGL